MTQVHQFEIITLGLKILMGFIGTLTIGIGGSGLMNIMLVFGDAADTRDWRAEGAWRAAALHPAAVSRRSSHHYLHGRSAGSGTGLCGRAFGGKADFV